MNTHPGCERVVTENSLHESVSTRVECRRRGVAVVASHTHKYIVHFKSYSNKYTKTRINKTFYYKILYGENQYREHIS